ncbi:MAG: hypothetical protein AABY53_04600 [Bdellovibrionota bacterium]
MKKYLSAALMVFLMLGSTSFAGVGVDDPSDPDGEEITLPTEDQASPHMVKYRKEILSVCEGFASILAEAGYPGLAAQCSKASLSPYTGDAYVNNINDVKKTEKNTSKYKLLAHVSSLVAISLIPLYDLDPNSRYLFIK